MLKVKPSGAATIIRNRQKINSAIENAQAFLKVQEEFGSFNTYMWGFVNGKPIQNAWQTMSDIPAETELAVKRTPWYLHPTRV